MLSQKLSTPKLSPSLSPKPRLKRTISIGDINTLKQSDERYYNTTLSPELITMTDVVNTFYDRKNKHNISVEV